MRRGIVGVDGCTNIGPDLVDKKAIMRDQISVFGFKLLFVPPSSVELRIQVV